jgi:putative transposase
MSFYPASPGLSRRFRLVHASFLEKDGLPFAEVLPAERIDEVFTEAGVAFPEDEECVYTPAVTLWAFLSQALAKDELRSCVMAVSRVIVLLVALGREPCSKNTGAYCRARARLPEVVLERLAVEVGRGCEDAAPSDWLWWRRHVLLADGTTVSMSDTPENQAEYPQHTAQQEGLGFPIARMVVLLSLATGMLCGMAMGPYSGKETGEPALFRELLPQVDPRTILLTDRYYCSYFLIALVLLGRRDFVTRLHQCRKIDFHKARRLGDGDWLVEWTRPQRPDWMDEETYAQVPESIRLRLIEVQVRQRGFRVDRFTVVTTLMDPREYPKEEIAALYRKRWLAELDIRAIKATLGMDVLRAKTPAMVRREIWTCLLAYNLIRKSILQSASEAGLSPRELSFAAAMQTIVSSLEVLAVLELAPCLNADFAARLVTGQLESLPHQTVGHRPGRVEPRAVKRRPSPIALLTKLRQEARAELLAGTAKQA